MEKAQIFESFFPCKQVLLSSYILISHQLSKAVGQSFGMQNIEGRAPVFPELCP